MSALNVLDQPLQLCSESPLTGFFRNGYCQTESDDRGQHTVCAVVDNAFLQYTLDQGNDLLTPRPALGFPGLKPGDHWCVCAARWKEAHQEGRAPKVVLAATHKKALDVIDLDTLLMYAVDIPKNA
ncbi:MAG: DUF2237 family protein [Sedimenticolaceae bacterium]